MSPIRASSAPIVATRLHEAVGDEHVAVRLNAEEPLAGEGGPRFVGEAHRPPEGREDPGRRFAPARTDLAGAGRFRVRDAGPERAAVLRMSSTWASTRLSRPPSVAAITMRIVPPAKVVIGDRGETPLTLAR
jgi:hypothetical protein